MRYIPRSCLQPESSLATADIQYGEVWGGNLFTINFPANTDALCAANQSVTLDAADRTKVTTEYDNIGRAIAAWEASSEVSAYTSKFDAWKAGMVALSADEEKGWALFNDKAKCARCHVPDGLKPARPRRTPSSHS